MPLELKERVDSAQEGEGYRGKDVKASTEEVMLALSLKASLGIV